MAISDEPILPQEPTSDLLHHELRVKLNDAHSLLLQIHKALLDHERERYEKQHGRIEAPGELLQKVINDPWFDWLKALSTLITQIDEWTANKDPVDLGKGNVLLHQSRQLLAPKEAGSQFQRAYTRTIQESPEVASLHGQWKRFLQTLKPLP
jgi:hypothetical protein